MNKPQPKVRAKPTVRTQSSTPTNGMVSAVSDPTPQHEPKNTAGVQPNEITVVQKPERHGVVDTRYTPLNHLIKHTEGDPWQVNYYRQLLAMSDVKRSLQQGTLPANQAYEEIRNFIVKVTSPLDPSQDEETKSFNVVGEAGVEFITPNEGDMFVADIGDGRSGLFTVTSSTRLMINKMAAYNIRYELVAEYKGTWRQDLESKVARTFYYDHTLIELYESPFLTPDDYVTQVELSELEYQLRDLFENRFWARQVKSISIPNSMSELQYDGFHAAYCRAIALSSQPRPIHLYQNGLLPIGKPLTIWDMFEEMSVFNLRYVHKEFALVHTGNFSQLPTARSVTWTHYDSTLYPQGVVDTIEEYIEHTGRPIEPIIPPMNRTLPALVAKDANMIAVPMFHPVGIDNHYVFTKAFYDNDTANMCVAERVAMDMLEGKPILPSVVAQLAHELTRRSHLDQFYFIPIILTMIYYARRGS